MWSPVFEKVVVAVARSNSKNPIFGLDDRVDIARECAVGGVAIRVFHVEGRL